MQMIQAYYDQSGSLVMGPRTGTPMRLVSPAPVLVPPGAQRAPQASIYPPQPQTAQQNLYSQQNGSSVGGKLSIFLFLFHKSKTKKQKKNGKNSFFIFIATIILLYNLINPKI